MDAKERESAYDCIVVRREDFDVKCTWLSCLEAELGNWLDWKSKTITLFVSMLPFLLPLDTYIIGLNTSVEALHIQQFHDFK